MFLAIGVGPPLSHFRHTQGVLGGFPRISRDCLIFGQGATVGRTCRHRRCFQFGEASQFDYINYPPEV